MFRNTIALYVKPMGKVNRKKKMLLLHRSAFLKRLSILLEEGYPLRDALYLLLPHHLKEYNFVLEEIDEKFRSGYGVTQILSYLGFSSGSLLPVVIAEVDGRLSDALHGMAIRLKKSDEAQRKIKRLLAYPTTLFIFITLLLLAFRKFFLPNMEALAASRTDEGNGFLSALPMLVARLPDLIFGTGALLGVLGIGCYLLYKKFTPDKKIRVLTALPVAGKVFSLWKTRTFASEMGSLLQSGLSMQDALDVLINQKLDPILSEISKNVKNYVIFGEPFHSAIASTAGLSNEFSSFAKHGADSGHLPKELIIYSEHLDERIDRQLATGLAVLQPALFSLIAICILAAYIALLLPVYGMIDKI
ncbi:competence type IV pilus assembly protein ComGB [Sporosarcina sp. G11-34]|uniref:competence type IV pilus assembly protein ComGB n=1 Tax=Sporosarcina sp. G11-34 TaxID=2849605 RepID=UPI0022A9648A|nr:competence type IV pilus assembly protein ComGB [Sporosarcina sp. G11-34]MCZ2260078.1 type II secretion system F family protein [Sporosarcina sp. G11-34]